VCYADATNDGNFAACNALEVGAALSVGESEVVNARNSSSVSVAPLTSTGGIVCFVDLSSEEDANQNDAAGPATCKVLSVDGVALSANPANVVNANPTEYLNVVGLSADAAMMCYSNQGAGEGFCRALSIAETTTTSTLTATETSSTTATLTSSTETSSTTSPHSTTATGTTETETSTPHTTTETSATTTPHTTTETLTSTTETSTTTANEIESSAGARVAIPACGLLAAILVAF
jgi:cell division septation protein DedD